MAKSKSEDTSVIYERWCDRSPVLLDPHKFYRGLDPYFAIMLSGIKGTLCELQYQGSVFATGPLTLPPEIRHTYPHPDYTQLRVPTLTLLLAESQREKEPITKILEGIASRTAGSRFIDQEKSRLQIEDKEALIQLSPALNARNKYLTFEEFLRMRKDISIPCVRVYVGNNKKVKYVHN